MPDLHLQFQQEGPVPQAERAPLGDAEAVAMLESAEFVAEKLVPWGSNYTFAVGLTAPEGSDHLGIYKPRRGERPLWDFPTGTLYRREVASYRLSRLLGWDIVPPTVVRNGPHGVGSLQLYVAPVAGNEDDHQFWGQRIEPIEKIVLFDHIANNADRKIGHCLVDHGGRIWGIDHGLTFNVDPKLRTVLWQFNGDPISRPLLDDLRRLDDDGAILVSTLAGHLDRDELDALQFRIAALVDLGCYPELDPHRNIPHGWW
jgi:hypothetical protein